jgi:sodium-dependent dicarboxylate transporter 2/3/5
MATEQAVALDAAPGGFPWLRRAGLIAGPLLGLLLWLAGAPDGLDPRGWAAVCVLSVMVLWWISEALPVAATALVPLLALPVFGIATPAAAAAPYADPIVYLFVCGFMLAAAVERWGLHSRIALGIAAFFGARPARLLAGLMVASAALSMWISNTATALMLMPIALGVASAVASDGRPDPRLGALLVLAVAYGASVGGLGTPIGSPTNLVAMGFLERQGIAISFPQWMALALPVTLLMLVLIWALLARTLPADTGRDPAAAAAVIRAARHALGPVRTPEWRVGAVFGAVAVCWVLREAINALPGLAGITDLGIAIAGVLVLFVLPSGDPARPGPLLDWPSAERIPWGIALVFGAGLSMATAMEATGVTRWLGANLGWLGAYGPYLILLILVGLVIFLTEVSSNTATLTAMLPVIAAVAAALSMPPLTLAFAAAMAASCAFMLPIATPPNAIAYGTGLVPIRTMVRIGLWLNLVGIVVIATVVHLLGPFLLPG